MMSAPVVCTGSTSSSQNKFSVAFIRSLSVRYVPRRRTQRRQYSLPADCTAGTVVTSHPHPTHTPQGRNERHTSSGAHVDTQLTAEIDTRVTSPAHVEEDVLVHSTSRDIAGGVEPGMPDVDPEVSQEHYERPTLPEPDSSPSGTVMLETNRTQRTVRNKIQHAKTQMRSIGIVVGRLKRKSTAIAGSIVTANTTQPTLPSSVQNQSQDSRTAQHEEADPAIIPHTGSVEQTTRESEEIKKLRRDLSETHAQLAEVQKRCEAQARDLEGSNNFLNTADKSSDSDVIRALQRLNAEVQQNATYMADSLAEEFEFKNATTNLTREQTSTVQRVSDHIGQILVKSLGSNTPEEMPMLLQIAFQAYLASALCQAASAWAFEPGYNAFIYGIYQKLRKAEAQAISGRWRSLARVHIVHSWNAHPESLVKAILSDISDILLAAGCTAPQPEIVFKVTAKFEEKVALLVDLAGRLTKIFDEVISSDFEVFVAIPGEKFEDKVMEDADDDRVGIQETSVLCATHIGLTKRMPVTGTLWEKAKKQKVTVLKAKVVRESFLHAGGL